MTSRLLADPPAETWQREPAAQTTWPLDTSAALTIQLVPAPRQSTSQSLFFLQVSVQPQPPAQLQVAPFSHSC
jgi:hypothetical protein